MMIQHWREELDCQNSTHEIAFDVRELQKKTGIELNFMS